MIERALAAFASQNTLRLPAALEVGASKFQFLHKPANIRIVGVGCHRGTELCDDTMRTGGPVEDEGFGLRLDEDVAQQIFLAVGIEPSGKQKGRFRIPAARAPCAIEDVGRTIDRIDAGQHRLGWIVPVVRSLGIAFARNLEQIAALGA